MTQNAENVLDHFELFRGAGIYRDAARTRRECSRIRVTARRTRAGKRMDQDRRNIARRTSPAKR